jgi:hypothetical protein
MRFPVCSFCLRWYIGNGEVAKMTDEERWKFIVAALRNDSANWHTTHLARVHAAEEIERLAESVRFWKAEAFKAGNARIKADSEIERLAAENEEERELGL